MCQSTSWTCSLLQGNNTLGCNHIASWLSIQNYIFCRRNNWLLMGSSLPRMCPFEGGASTPSPGLALPQRVASEKRAWLVVGALRMRSLSRWEHSHHFTWSRWSLALFLKSGPNIFGSYIQEISILLDQGQQSLINGIHHLLTSESWELRRCIPN